MTLKNLALNRPIVANQGCYSNYSSDKIANGNLDSNEGYISINALPVSLTIELEKAIEIEKIKLKQVYLGGNLGRCKDFDILCSNNNIEYQIVLSSTLLNNEYLQEFKITEMKSYKYLRLYIKNNYAGDSSSNGINEIEIYSIYNKYLIQDKSNILYSLEDENKYTENLIPKMTSYNTPNGVVTSSGENTSAYPAWKAFNGTNENNVDCWASTSGSPTGWLQYDFGVGNEKIVVKYSIEARNDGNLTETPKSWQFQCSNNGIDWITLDTQTDTQKWIAKEVREYCFVNNTKYRFYRLNITANHGNFYVTVGQLKMFEKVTPKLNILGNNLTEDLFKDKGFDNPTIIQKGLINEKGLYGLDKGSLGSGKLFECNLTNDVKKISYSDKIYLTEIIEDFEGKRNKFNFDGRWEIKTDSDSNIKNHLFATPIGSYYSSNLIFTCKCKRIKFKYKLTYTYGHGSYSLTIDGKKVNINSTSDWQDFEIEFDSDTEHKLEFSLNNDGNSTCLSIDNINILTMTNKQLIQYNDEFYTFDGESIILSSLQELSENNIKDNGFNDITVISKEKWNEIFPNKEDIKILMWTDDMDKQVPKLTYECEPFELIDWLKKDECKLFVYTDDLEKKECEMIYNCKPYKPIDILKKNSDTCNILVKEG